MTGPCPHRKFGKRKANQSQRGTQPLIETLEPRRMLSSAYTVTDLGPIGQTLVAPAARGFMSLRLNNRGQVIGLVQTNTGQGWSSFFYSDGTVRPLRTLSPRLRTAQVADINDSGQIVGEYDAGRRTYEYFPPGYFSSGGYVKTGLLDAFEYTPPAPGAVGRAARGTFVHVAAGQAMALNNSGLVAGTFTVRDRSTHHRGIAMYVYDPSVRHAKPRAVTPPDQGFSPVVMDNSGDVLAQAFEISGGWQTWLYTAATGQVTRLNVPSGSTVMDMNDSGQVVGGSGAIALGSTGNAFIYSAGQTTDIGNLGGGTATAAAINASGEVVGISAIPSGNTIPIGTYPTAAFIYRNGAMTDLNALAPPSQTGWNLQGATDINNAGQITALAIPAGNMPVSSIEAVLLTPVAASAASPRPSSSPAQRAAVFPQPAGSKSPDGMPLGRSTSGSQRHLSIPATSSPRHHYR